MLLLVSNALDAACGLCICNERVCLCVNDVSYLCLCALHAAPLARCTGMCARRNECLCVRYNHIVCNYMSVCPVLRVHSPSLEL